MKPFHDKKFLAAWKQLSSVLVIDSVASYRRARRLLDNLIDQVGGDEKHPLASLMATLGTLIEAWESEQDERKLAKRSVVYSAALH